jgi:acyl carrier protein
MSEMLIAAISQILECEPKELTLSTSFRDQSNWDSLAYLSLIATIDSEFGVAIPQLDFKKLKTISDIADYIATHR